MGKENLMFNGPVSTKWPLQQTLVTFWRNELLPLTPWQLQPGTVRPLIIFHLLNLSSKAQFPVGRSNAATSLVVNSAYALEPCLLGLFARKVTINASNGAYMFHLALLLRKVMWPWRLVSSVRRRHLPDNAARRNSKSNSTPGGQSTRELQRAIEFSPKVSNFQGLITVLFQTAAALFVNFSSTVAVAEMS